MRNEKKADEAGVDRMMGRVIAGKDRERTGARWARRASAELTRPDPKGK